MLGCHAQWGKSSPWEESIRIPFIVSKIGGRDNMKTGYCPAVINHVDIAPTTLGLCGLSVPENMVGHRLGEFAPTRIFRGHSTRSTEETSDVR